MTTKEYNIIVEQQADHLYRFLLKSTRQNATAQDLVQLSFERLWKNRKKVVFEKAKSYLFTIGYRAMIDLFRKNKHEFSYEVVPEKRVRPKAGNFELKQWLELGLKELNEQQRSLILLRDYEGYSYQEIGEITDLNESQVKVYLFRARKALKQFFITHYQQEMKAYGYS